MPIFVPVVGSITRSESGCFILILSAHESRWQEVNRVLSPGGVVEVIEHGMSTRSHWRPEFMFH